MVFALAGDSTITRALSLRARTTGAAGAASPALVFAAALPLADFLAGAALAVRAVLAGFSAFLRLFALSSLCTFCALFLLVDLVDLVDLGGRRLLSWHVNSPWKLALRPGGDRSIRRALLPL